MRKYREVIKCKFANLNNRIKYANLFFYFRRHLFVFETFPNMYFFRSYEITKEAKKAYSVCVILLVCHHTCAFFCAIKFNIIIHNLQHNIELRSRRKNFKNNNNLTMFYLVLNSVRSIAYIEPCVSNIIFRNKTILYYYIHLKVYRHSYTTTTVAI